MNIITAVSTKITNRSVFLLIILLSLGEGWEGGD